MKRACKILVKAILNCLFFTLFFGNYSFAQTQYFKFPITESGVYKISQNQLSQLGSTSIENVTIFGNPGLLPQKLDSLDLTLREIPTIIFNNDLYVYLEGPHTTEGKIADWEYHHHYYSDTIFYLASNQNPTIRISEAEFSTTGSNGTLHHIQVNKEEQLNLLTSGRNWYGNPFYSGQAYRYTFPVPTRNTGSGIVKAKIMAQSLQESKLNLAINGQSRLEFTIPSIPNATYGIKGREETVKSNITLESNANATFIINQQTADINGGAYMDYVSIATAFSNTNLPNGEFYNLTGSPILTSNISGKEIFILKDIYNTRHVNSQTIIQANEKTVVFSPNDSKIISAFSNANLSLRNSPINQSLVIICAESLKSQADRLAAHKNTLGISTKVVTSRDIFDSFGYGTKDITAIRNFLAYHYNQSNQIKNVLFFGKGTIDYKDIIAGGRPNLVPTYSSRNSLNPLATYSSDDYFGFLEFGQGEWEETSAGDEALKIGIGRIPAINIQEAREMVDKLIAYESKSANQGDWKRKIALFADDGDNNIHLNDAESHANFIKENHPEYIVEKLYLDKFEQIRTSGRQTSPQAKKALESTIEDGVLILNYIGHGNETTLTAEQVFQTSDLRDWVDNPYLPLFVTATCEFGRHDSPFVRSGAEEMLFTTRKGAIGLLTTGRPVFSSLNFALNKAFVEAVFQKENGENLDLGEIFKRTKNNSLNGAFNRNFSLLGDPSMKLASPDLESPIKEVIDLDIQMEVDTLRAMQRINVRGIITDPLTQSSITNAKGEFKLVLFDKKKSEQTLGDESNPVYYLVEGDILFQGTGDFVNGEFEAEIFIPKNINPEFGEGIIRVFAELDNGQEAMSARKVTVGGTKVAIPEDTEGPEIEMLFGNKYGENLDTFSAKNIKMMVNFTDESGVNISTSNTGQNITLRINGGEPLLLNSFYFSIQNSFKKGRILVPIEGLEEGINLITLEAWDNVGNRSLVEREIIVEGSTTLKILKNTTYPNPSSEVSKFRIEHNRTGENLIVHLRVFNTSGSEIYRASKRYVRADYILDDFEWIFFHSKTKYPTKGTYIYELQLISELDNTSDRKSGKIIIK